MVLVILDLFLLLNVMSLTFPFSMILIKRYHIYIIYIMDVYHVWNVFLRDFPGDPVTKTLVSQCRGPTSQQTGTHMLQLRVCMLQLKSPHSTMKIKDPIYHSYDMAQLNNYFSKKCVPLFLVD